MEKITEAVKPPRSYDEFIERYAPLFAAHPNELAMTVRRDDDEGFHGGPGMRSPWGDRHKGTVMNTSYWLAVIDPAKTFAGATMSLVLPVGSALLVHCHGTVTLEDRQMEVIAFDILGIEETLVDDFDRGKVRLPKWEIFVGDEEVRKALESVRNGAELLALDAAARKLGRPIKGAPKLDQARDLVVDPIVIDILGRLLRASGYKSPCLALAGNPAFAKCFAMLKEFGIGPEEAKALCRKKMEALLAAFPS